MPDGFVILFLLVVLVCLMTYFVPAGEFKRIVKDGKTIVDGNSFHYIKQTPLSPFQFFKAIPTGIQAASTLMIMILLIGGAVRVFDSTGAIRAALFRLREIIGQDRGAFILIAVMIFFGCLGAFPGMLEAAIPFAPLCIGISLALGYDVLVGIYIALVPIVIGWSAGCTNPWTTGIGQSLAELPMFSGLGYRLFVFVIFMAVTIFYILRYANKIKKNPSKSIVYGMDFSHIENEKIEDNIKFTLRHKLVLITFALTIFFIVYGSLNWKWGMTEMSAVYIIGGIIGGVVAGYDANQIASEFLEGGKSIFIAAMAVGLARSIQVIMEQGHIADTIVYALASLLNGLPPAFNSVGMFFIQTVINFFIPSGSGQAVVTLPIMLPVADIIHLNRQIAILAFQFGDGLSNLCYPTVGALIAFLSYSKVSFNKWMKFIMPFMLLIWTAAIVSLIGAAVINLGPM